MDKEHTAQWVDTVQGADYSPDLYPNSGSPSITESFESLGDADIARFPDAGFLAVRSA